MLGTSTITQKGQVTIPVNLRKKLGLKTNERVSFSLDNKSRIVIEKPVDFFSLKGSIKGPKEFNIEKMHNAVSTYLADNYEKSN